MYRVNAADDAFERGAFLVYLDKSIKAGDGLSRIQTVMSPCQWRCPFPGGLGSLSPLLFNCWWGLFEVSRWYVEFSEGRLLFYGNLQYLGRWW